MRAFEDLAVNSRQAAQAGTRSAASEGVSSTGYAAQARLRDAHGQTHYVMVEPDGDMELAAGSEVLLVRRAGPRFLAIPNPNPLLSD